MKVRAFVTIALAAGLSTVFLWARPATTLPPDFTDSPVTDVPAPTALAFTPDDRILIASKPGELRVYDGSTSTPALDISSKVCDNKERGLLGVAVDPNFSTNGYVYIYYTFNKHDACPQKQPASNLNPVNRVSRFVMNGNTVDESSEEILLDNIPSPNGNHNSGDLHFGKDGNLYITVGDGGCEVRRPSRCQYENGTARYRHFLNGKLLRIEPDGGIPPGNPFQGQDSARCAEDGRTARGETCQEIFAMGFRNPFRFAVDPDAAGTVLRIDDVGGARWEEIDELDAASDAGADYGWNLCEGRHDNPDRSGKVNCNGGRFTGPIHEYGHGTNCESITGGAFVPDGGSWPDAYDDSYLFADFVCSKIFELKPQSDGTGFRRELFTNVEDGGPIAMQFAPSGTQDLYYTTFSGGGQVRHIEYTPPGP